MPSLLLRDKVHNYTHTLDILFFPQWTGKCPPFLGLHYKINSGKTIHGLPFNSSPTHQGKVYVSLVGKIIETLASGRATDVFRSS